MNLVGSIICFVGTDGSGKTTLAKKLMDELDKKGYPSKYVWFRFPHFFTLAILFVAKITGFTEYVTKAKSQIVTHHFQIQPFRTLYSLVLLFDILLYYTVKVWFVSKLGYIVLCDRWVYDILVDFSVDTSNKRIYRTTIGRLLLSLASRARVTLFIDAPDHVLDTRRPGARLNPHTRYRRFFYRLLAKSYGMPTIHSTGEFGITFKTMLGLLQHELEIDFWRPRRLDHYVPQVKLPFLWPLLKNKYVIIVINWTFQGMLYAMWSERLFRMALELIFVTIIYIPFLSLLHSPVIAALSSLFIAHTLNYTFNSCNPWGVLKFCGRTFDVEKNIGFLQEITKKMGGTFGKSILAIATFGSMSRDQFDETSDVDVRIIRRHGVFNYIMTNTFALYLRSIAFIKKIPIDLFVLDDVNQIERHIRPDEPPIVIYDPTNTLSAINEQAIPLHNVIQRYQVAEPKAVMEKPATTEMGLSSSRYLKKLRSSRLFNVTNAQAHIVLFKLRRPRIRLKNAMFIASVDIDVGSKVVGLINKGKNDMNLSRNLSEYSIGEIEQRVFPTLVDFFNKLEIPVTFAIRGQMLEADTSIIEIIRNSSVKHDVGSHGYHHRDFTNLSYYEAHHELSLIASAMKKIGVTPKSFVYPRNKVAYLDLIEEYGYTCYRGHDGFLNDDMCIEKRGQLYNINPSYFIGRNTHPLFLEKFGAISIARKLPFHIWFHPRDFGKTGGSVHRNLSRTLFPLLEYLKKKEKNGLLTFETMSSAANKVKDRF